MKSRRLTVNIAGPPRLFSAASVGRYKPLRSVSRTFSLPQRGWLVLGANLKCSESRLGRPALDVPLTLTRIAHDDGIDGGAAQTTRDYVRPARSIFSNAPNLRCSALAALVRSPWQYCPFRLPVGPPLPLAPPCNRQRPFFVAGELSRCERSCMSPSIACVEFFRFDSILRAPSRSH
jgi:hypothetical protein